MTGEPTVLTASSAHTPDEARYLTRLDALLPTVLAGRVDPDDVGSLWYGGVLVWTAVPGVPDGERPVITNQLQVLYDGSSLGAYWGCSHLWDDFDQGDPEHLCVETSGLTPEQAADRAAAWLEEQLHRPLVRREWDRRGRPTASQWVLTDTGRVLGSRGRVWRRSQRPPDRVVSQH